MLALVVIPLIFFVLGRTIYAGQSREFAFLTVFLSFITLLVGNAVLLALIAAVMILVSVVTEDVLPTDIEILNFVDSNFSRLLLVIFCMIFISAIFLFLARRPLLRRFPLFQMTLDDYEICEYYIQWSTIFLAVYQFVFQGFTSLSQEIVGATNVAEKFSLVFTPTNINLIVQPLLIASWITVVLEKYRLRLQIEGPDNLAPEETAVIEEP